MSRDRRTLSIHLWPEPKEQASAGYDETFESYMLSPERIEAYHQNGFVKVEGLFSESEVEELAGDMVAIIEQWGEETIGWKGPWRDRYLDQEERANTKAVFLHNPEFYSAAWGRAVTRVDRSTTSWGPTRPRICRWMSTTRTGWSRSRRR